jgi:riboflavin synthase
MFTGIIEQTGSITAIRSQKGNKSFWINSPLSASLKIDQSVNHDGVCLTVEEKNNESHRVTAIEETLKKTNLNGWKEGTLVNLERCVPLNGRLDGHLVQGHIDTTGLCRKIISRNGSQEFEFWFPKKFAPYLIEKGSVCVNGVSLTTFNVKKSRFSVAIIPYTFQHTNLQFLKNGDEINLEFDLIGKYILRKLTLEKSKS